MELNQLKYFYIVAREGGFSRAAKVIRVAQPSISKQVRRLEDDLGCDLFERVGRRVRLTKRGGDVFRHCDVIFHEVDRIKALSRMKQGSASGPLAFGGPEAIISHLIPDVLLALLARYPKILPSALVTPAADLLRGIAGGQLELGLFLHLPELSPELEVRAKIMVPHRVVIAARSYSSKKVRARFLGSRELEDPSTVAFPTLKKLQQQIPGTSICISTNSISAQKALVLEGYGVAVMPLFVVEKEIRRGRLRCLLEEERLEWPIQVVLRKDRILSRNGEMLIAELRRRLG